MAEALVSEFKTPVGKSHGIQEITLIPSGGGRFEVVVDGELVFSKKATGRHADPAEVLRSIHEMMSP